MTNVVAGSSAVSIADRFSALPPLLVDDRVSRLRAALADAEVDALLLSAASNIRYLTGFTGSAGVVVVTSDDMVLVTDGRYTEQAADQLSTSNAPCRLEITSTAQREVLASTLTNAKRIGLEADHITWSAQRRYSSDGSSPAGWPISGRAGP